MSGDAASLRCPGCGAPATPEATACGYCRSTLATVSCPTCFGLLFRGAAFCHHCGTARNRAETGPAPGIACPSCQGQMHWTRVGEADLLECGGCSGTWVETVTFDRICSDRDARGALLHARPAADPASTLQPVRYRKCPRCRKMMNRVNFGRISGAIIDVCKGDGAFLDRGELHQIVRFINEGGMERKRAAELDAIKEEQRRLRDLQREQARLAPSGESNSWNETAFGELLKAMFK